MMIVIGVVFFNLLVLDVVSVRLYFVFIGMLYKFWVMWIFLLFFIKNFMFDVRLKVMFLCLGFMFLFVDVIWFIGDLMDVYCEIK